MDEVFGVWQKGIREQSHKNSSLRLSNTRCRTNLWCLMMRRRTTSMWRRKYSVIRNTLKSTQTMGLTSKMNPVWCFFENEGITQTGYTTQIEEFWYKLDRHMRSRVTQIIERAMTKFKVVILRWFANKWAVLFSVHKIEHASSDHQQNTPRCFRQRSRLRKQHTSMLEQCRPFESDAI